jgi:hypothetical protein
MAPSPDRRSFLFSSLAALWAGTLRARAQDPAGTAAREPLFRISLAQWSLHRELYGRSGPRLDALEFPKVARSLGFDAVEYVNQFFKDKARDQAWLTELKKVCDGEGVRSLLIMCDGEGRLGDPDEAARRKSVENHHR